MAPFDPTRAPDGRLARLGVVVDPSDPSAVPIARFADLAGIDVVWTMSLGDGPSGDDHAIGKALSRARFGVFVDGPTWGAQEVTVSAGDATATIADRLRQDIDLHEGHVRLAAVAASQAQFAVLLGIVDDIVLPAWKFPDLETAADEARAEAQEIGRDPATLGVAALVPVSIGRTSTEAEARADRDPRFASLGHPRDVGIFGTLEECQDRVIALAHAGITDLRCILPGCPGRPRRDRPADRRDDRHDGCARAGIAPIAGPAAPGGLGWAPGAAAAPRRQRRLPAAIDVTRIRPPIPLSPVSPSAGRTARD